MTTNNEGGEGMANDSSGHFINAFLLGGIVGFVIGVLAAPRSGEEMRHEISERTKGIREQAEHLAERVRHYVHPDDADASESGDASKD